MGEALQLLVQGEQIFLVRGMHGEHNYFLTQAAVAAYEAKLAQLRSFDQKILKELAILEPDEDGALFRTRLSGLAAAALPPRRPWHKRP
ncbi:hypothetical protein Ndes2526B_g08110 [Nannochloris sp. 'desiccata']|nr:hypothetical protein KSW81_002744 [Chlorella desiccata (nom. nud.)]KAH7617501.1 hypothetical protein NADE_007279 [Chlorella desiccata (nom. nud.)]